MEHLEVIKDTVIEYQNLEIIKDDEISEKFKDCLKGFTSLVSRVTNNPKVHTQFVKNFDCEQIWQQLINNDEAQLKDQPKIQQQIAKNKDILSFAAKQKNKKKISIDESDHSEEYNDLDDDIDDQDIMDYDDLENDGGEFDEDTQEDDEALDFDDMNAFQDQAEDEEMMANQEAEEGGFNMADSEDMDSDEKDLENQDPNGDLRALKGGFEDIGDEDFDDIEGVDLGIFDEDNSQDGGDAGQFPSKQGKKDKKKFDQGIGDDTKFDEEEDDEGTQEDDQNEDEIFEDMRERQMEIDQAEQQEQEEEDPNDEIAIREQKLIASKPWQLKGEVRGLDRPKNALLEEHVDVEFGTSNKVIVTKEMNQSLEDMIRQRIQDEQYDDPKEWVRPALFKENYNLLEDINLEKDKRGLGEIYEEDYKKNILGMSAETKEGKMKLEIEDQFKQINHYQDNLTNFSFTPKFDVLPTLNKGKNVEAIRLEEKIPIQISNKTLLAPEERFKAKSKDFYNKEELTHDQKRNLRRALKNKIRRQNKSDAKKKLVQKLDHMGQTKYEYNIVEKNKKKIEKEAADYANKGKETTKFTKSSNFFSNMQELSKRPPPKDDSNTKVKKNNAKKLKQ